jgi:hypothetical protein
MLIESTLVSIAREGIADGSIRADMAPEQLVGMILTSSWLLQKEILVREERRVASSDKQLGELLPTWIQLVADGLKPQA